MTPELGIVATNSTRRPDDLGAITNSCTMPLRNQEAMTKITAETTLHKTAGEPLHAYSVAMAGTVAPRHTLPRRGHKTMSTTMPRRALQDGVACKTS
jgi:hypothetical protein